MIASTRQTSLKEQHQELEARIEDQLKRPLPDTLEISRLKREKLRIKEELAAVENGARPRRH